MTALSVPRGLDGVVVDETAVCLADKQTDRLYYRGYAIEELAAHASYEEVFYLVTAGELPDEQQLAAQRANNRIIHPSSHYTGPAPRPFLPLAARATAAPGS